MRQQGMYMQTLHERRPSRPQALKRPAAPQGQDVPVFDRGVAPALAAPLPPLDALGVHQLHAFLATFMLRSVL